MLSICFNCSSEYESDPSNISSPCRTLTLETDIPSIDHPFLDVYIYIYIYKSNWYTYIYIFPHLSHTHYLYLYIYIIDLPISCIPNFLPWLNDFLHQVQQALARPGAVERWEHVGTCGNWGFQRLMLPEKSAGVYHHEFGHLYVCVWNHSRIKIAERFSETEGVALAITNRWGTPTIEIWLNLFDSVCSYHYLCCGMLLNVYFFRYVSHESWWSIVPVGFWGWWPQKMEASHHQNRTPHVTLPTADVHYIPWPWYVRCVNRCS